MDEIAGLVMGSVVVEEVTSLGLAALGGGGCYHRKFLGCSTNDPIDS